MQNAVQRTEAGILQKLGGKGLDSGDVALGLKLSGPGVMFVHMCGGGEGACE